MGGDKLDVRLVIGGLWEGAPLVDGEGTLGTALGYVDAAGECGCFFGWYDTEHEGDVSLRLPGPRGLGLAGLLWGVRKRAGIDSDGVLSMTGSGATWQARREIEKACQSGDEHRIVWASMRLAMTDALAAKRDYPTGPGAPVWAWTKARLPDRHGVQQWKLSARASSKEGWSSWYSCDLEDPDAALEATWRKECAS